MKVLLSAFAFSPILGSECGVGWHWALALARRHEVTVLTHAWFRKDVEDALVSNPVKNLRVEYFHVEPFWAIFRRSHLDSQIYITYWQICVRGFAKQLQNRDGYDLAHHLTLGSIRYPSWLGFVAKRYIVGPLGGGSVHLRAFIAACRGETGCTSCSATWCCTHSRWIPLLNLHCRGQKRFFAVHVIRRDSSRNTCRERWSWLMRSALRIHARAPSQFG